MNPKPVPPRQTNPNRLQSVTALETGLLEASKGVGEWKKRMETTVTATYGLELSRWVWNGGVSIGPMQLIVPSLPAKHYIAGLVLPE